MKMIPSERGILRNIHLITLKVDLHSHICKTFTLNTFCYLMPLILSINYVLFRTFHRNIFFNEVRHTWQSQRGNIMNLNLINKRSYTHAEHSRAAFDQFNQIIKGCDVKIILLCISLLNCFCVEELLCGSEKEDL